MDAQHGVKLIHALSAQPVVRIAIHSSMDLQLVQLHLNQIHIYSLVQPRQRRIVKPVEILRTF